MASVYPTSEACAIQALRDAWIVFLGRWDWDWFWGYPYLS